MAYKDPEGGEGRLPNGRYAAGNKWGAMKGVFQTPEELRDAIQEYFVEIVKPINRQLRPTVNGLCYHLGFASRQSFHDYEKREGYDYYCKRATLFILSCYEEKLHTRDWGGAAFALKNIEKGYWTDEVIQHQRVEEVKANFGVEKKDEG